MALSPRAIPRKRRSMGSLIALSKTGFWPANWTEQKRKNTIIDFGMEKTTLNGLSIYRIEGLNPIKKRF
jgi:hypothetical protein